jgi:hypothetical protein
VLVADHLTGRRKQTSPVLHDTKFTGTVAHGKGGDRFLGWKSGHSTSSGANKKKLKIFLVQMPARSD